MGEPSVKRERRKSVGSTMGRAPETRSATRGPAPGPMPKPCPEKPVAKPGRAGLDGGDDRHRIGRRVDETGPALHGRAPSNTGKRRSGPRAPRPDSAGPARDRGCGRPRRRRSVSGRRRRLRHSWTKRGPKRSRSERVPLSARQKIGEETEAVRDDRHHVHMAVGDGVAAVAPLAEGEFRIP